MEALVLALAGAIATKSAESLGAEMGKNAPALVTRLITFLRSRFAGGSRQSQALESAVSEPDPDSSTTTALAEELSKEADADPEFAGRLAEFGRELGVPEKEVAKFETTVTGGTVKNIVNVHRADSLRFD